MNLKEVFNRTKTENNDDAFYSSNNKYIDLIFKLNEYRLNPSLISLSLDKNNEFDRWFALFVRDCRDGLGEREVGRKLLKKTEEKPENILEAGRADDIFYLGISEITENKDKTGGKYFEFLRKALTEKNFVDNTKLFNITKWMPRDRGNKKPLIKMFRESFHKKINSEQYRKMIVNSYTTEAVLSRNDKVENYSNVPSLAMLKHWKTFINKDNERFQQYLNDVKKGKAKINTGTMTPYDIALGFQTGKLSGSESNLIFNQLEKVKLGKIIPIVDNSGSMYDYFNSYLKARAIGHYVSKNSSYMNNYVISFSSQPKLLKLSDNYKDDMEILNSFRDVSNTDFGKVMNLLSQVKKDLPDYLLVLSDMQFDQGSSQSKDEAMRILKKFNPNIKIIWWNFCTLNSTFPETDKYGNLFLSGYSPTLLQYLEYGFDGNKFVKALVESYKNKMRDKIK